MGGVHGLGTAAGPGVSAGGTMLCADMLHRHRTTTRSTMTPDIETSFRELREGLRAFIAQRVRNDSDVEDLLQEVFLRMYRRMETLKDLRRLVPWVFQITRHAIIDYYRSPERQREFPIGLAADIDEGHPLT